MPMGAQRGPDAFVICTALVVKGEKKLQLSILKSDKGCIEISIEDNGIGRKKAFEFQKKKMIT